MLSETDTSLPLPPRDDTFSTTTIFLMHRPDLEEAAVDLVDVCIADIVVVEVADDESSPKLAGVRG